MKKMIMAAIVLASFTGIESFAQYRSNRLANQAIQDSSRLARNLERYADRLSDTELNQIIRALQTAQSVVDGDSGNFGNQCKLLGSGVYGGYIYSYRIAVNDQVLEGATSLSSAIEVINKYRNEGACARPRYVRDTCSLSGSGVYSGYIYSYLVKLNDNSISGATTIDSALSSIDTLQKNGICRTEATEACSLLPSGVYAGYIYSFRVGIGSTVVAGATTNDAAFEMMRKLRDSNLCF